MFLFDCLVRIVYLLLSHYAACGFKLTMRAVCKQCNVHRRPYSISYNLGITYLWRCPQCGSLIRSEIEEASQSLNSIQTETARREHLQEIDMSESMTQYILSKALNKILGGYYHDVERRNQIFPGQIYSNY